MDSKCTGRVVECALVQMPNNHMLIITLTTCRMKRSTSSGIEDEFYGEVVKDFVSEVKFSEEFGYRVCCFCVPFDGDAIISKALAAKAKKENKYTDDCVFDLGYVEGRVRANIVK